MPRFSRRNQMFFERFSRSIERFSAPSRLVTGNLEGGMSTGEKWDNDKGVASAGDRGHDELIKSCALCYDGS